jgi:signal transduction histidine kinase
VDQDRLVPVDMEGIQSVNRAVSCGVELPDGRAIVGTNNLGALLFDGRTFQPLAGRGPFAGRFRITDLCATAAGFFCAALDNVGLVFFARDGRIVQVLDRTVDHRFSRARRLLNTTGGTVWALLNEGVAQVQFPTRLSSFEPVVSTGLTYAQPARHDGRLWLIADGQAQRGVYDDDGRLLRFAIDTPNPWTSTLISSGDQLLAATAAGIFLRDGDGWRLIVGDVVNAHLGEVAGDPSRWVVVAQDEVGWMQRTADGYTYERFPVPGMGSCFGVIVAGEGAFWAELGTSRVARIVEGPTGALDTRIVGRNEGMPDGWVQIFCIDGAVRFNVAGRALRYDADMGRIVPDPGFLSQSPQLLGEHGRPARDARGRLWVTTNDSVRVLDDDTGGATTSREEMPPAFKPIAFTPEAGGVVWMHQRQRLVRFDPEMPQPPAEPLRALISHVHLIESDQHWFAFGTALPPFNHRNNSLVAHFAAPHHGLRFPITFDVRLEGGADTWVSTGTAGVASFTQLKEGDYVLHVRPRAESVTGAEATLAFSIRPPWYRTLAAYAAYTGAIILVVLGSATAWSLLARRKQVELERLVSVRTAELRRSEERFRRLSEELEERVDVRTTELHRANDRLMESNQELEAFSYSVSHDLRAPLRNISGFAELLRKRASGRIDADTDRYLGIVSTESVRLGELIDSLLVFSRLNRAEINRQPLELAGLVTAARTELAREAAGRAVDWRIGPLPQVEGDPTLLRQVFVNLLSNALKFTRGRDPAVIEIGRAPATSPGEIVIFVRDNGAGFDPKYTDKMFGVFQRLHSSRDYEGSGIGLATVRRIVVRHGGRTWAEGQPDRGATFYLTFPLAATVAVPTTKGK